jgi:hypothetical protein
MVVFQLGIELKMATMQVTSYQTRFVYSQSHYLPHSALCKPPAMNKLPNNKAFPE